MTTTPDRTPDRTTLTFRTPEDVLAAVPVLLGFELFWTNGCCG